MEYAKRSLRYFRDGTESSRSGTEGFPWSRFAGSAAAISYSKSYVPVLSDDKRPNVVRRLWPGSDDASKNVDSEPECKTLNHSLEGETRSGRKVSENVDATFGIAGSDGPKKQSEEENKNQELESESTSKPRPSRSEGVGSKRSWSSATVSTKTPAAGKPAQSSVPIQSDETVRTVPISQLGNSEDYFRLMAHIFNCIFR